MTLNKDQIVAAKDIQKEEVDVPEWDGSVFVKMMTGEERDAFELSIIDQKHQGKVNLENIRSKLCAMTICDDDGERLFTDKEVFVLSKKSAAALSKVFLVAQRLNGLDQATQDLIKEGFLEDQNDGSTSA